GDTALSTTCRSSRIASTKAKVRRRLSKPKLKLRRLLQTVAHAVASDSVILLRGESGTGKTVLARRIRAHSKWEPLAPGIPPHRQQFLRWMRFSKLPSAKNSRLAMCETVAPAGVQKERGRRKAVFSLLGAQGGLAPLTRTPPING